MTATIHRIHDICAAEAREATAYLASELRRQVPQGIPVTESKEAAAQRRAWDRAHDQMIEVQEMRAAWSANRNAQRDAKTGVYQPLFEPVSVSWRIRYALGSLGLVAVFCGYQWGVM